MFYGNIIIRRKTLRFRKGGYQMSKDTKKALKVIGEILFLIVAVSAMVKIYYELKWMDLTLGIFKIEKEKKKIAKVKCKSLMFITLIGEDEDTFKDEMETYGWSFYSKYGRGYLFARNGEEVLAVRKEHFGRYAVYEIQNKTVA